MRSSLVNEKVSRRPSRVYSAASMCGKAGLLAEAARLGEQFLRLLSKLVGLADVAFRGEPEDGLQLLTAKFVDHHLVGCDDHLRDFGATHGFDHDVFARLEAHPGGVEVKDLSGVSKAYASNARQFFRHKPRVLPLGVQPV